MGRDRSGSGGAGSHQTGTHPEQSQEDKSEAVSGYFRQPWLNARTLPPPRISAGHCWDQGLGCQLVRNSVAESQAPAVNCLRLHSASVEPGTTSYTSLGSFNSPKSCKRLQFIISNHK